MAVGKALRAQNVPRLVNEIDQDVLASYAIEDIIFLLDMRTKTFYGLKFDAIGTEFFVDKDLSLNVVAGFSLSEDLGSSFVVEDDKFVAAMEAYLQWRIAFLEKFHI